MLGMTRRVKNKAMMAVKDKKNTKVMKAVKAMKAVKRKNKATLKH